MKKTAIALVSTAFMLALALPAEAQWRGHGGGYRGGYHGGYHGAVMRGGGMYRHAGYGYRGGMYRGGWGYRGMGYRPVARAAYWNHGGHHHGGYGWGWGLAGLAAGAALAYPYYGGGYYYADPCYDYYSSYRPYYCY